VTCSGISNANPGVVTATANGFTNGDIVLQSSGWQDLEQRPVRVAAAATNTYSLEGFDTTSTTIYPAGAGAGTATKVSAWTALSQITDTQTSGGEQQYYQWVYLETGLQQQRPTYKNARSMQMTLDYDNALAWYNQLLTSDLTGSTYVLRAALPNGKLFYWSVVVGFDGEPSFNINQNMQVVATFSMANPRSTKY
jgi:hypothetical protein